MKHNSTGSYPYPDYFIMKTTQNFSLRQKNPKFSILTSNLPLFFNQELARLRNVKHPNAKNPKKKNERSMSVDIETKKIEERMLHNKIIEKVEKKHDLIKKKNGNERVFSKTIEKIKEPIEKQIDMNKFVKQVMIDIKEREFIDDFYIEKEGEMTRQDKVFSKKSIPDIDKEMRVITYKNMNEESLNNLYKQYNLMKLQKKLLHKREQQIQYYKNYPKDEADIDEEYENRLKLITINSEDSIKKIADVNKKRNRLKIKHEQDFKFLKAVCDKNTIKVTDILDINDKGINFLPDEGIKTDSVMGDKNKKKIRMIKKPVSDLDKILENEEEKKIERRKINSKPSSSVSSLLKFSESSIQKNINKQSQELLTSVKSPLDPQDSGDLSSARKNLNQISTSRSHYFHDSSPRKLEKFNTSSSNHIPASLTSRKANNDNSESLKIKTFVSECQKESLVFQESKTKLEQQIKRAFRRTQRDYGKMKFKDEDQLVKDSKEFDTFQSQRIFKRQLINYLINKVDKANRASLVMRYKHKVQSEHNNEKDDEEDNQSADNF